MFILIALAFLAIPVLELYVIIQVSGGIGFLNTLGLLILVSMVGAWLVRREGIGVIRRVQSQLASGTMPGKQLVDGALILFAGALMVTPGFVTDAVGLFLLIPPTRILVRSFLMHRFKGRVQVAGLGGAGAPRRGFGGPIFDVDSSERPRPGRPDRVELNRDDLPPEPPASNR